MTYGFNANLDGYCLIHFMVHTQVVTMAFNICTQPTYQILFNEYRRFQQITFTRVKILAISCQDICIIAFQGTNLFLCNFVFFHILRWKIVLWASLINTCFDCFISFFLKFPLMEFYFVYFFYFVSFLLYLLLTPHEMNILSKSSNFVVLLLLLLLLLVG